MLNLLVSIMSVVTSSTVLISRAGSSCVGDIEPYWQGPSQESGRGIFTHLPKHFRGSLWQGPDRMVTPGLRCNEGRRRSARCDRELLMGMSAPCPYFAHPKSMNASHWQKSIRGAGLAYGAHVSHSAEIGLLQFSLYRVRRLASL